MTAFKLTPEERTIRSSQLLEQFNGLYTGDVVTILATALQMAICYGAHSKDDAIHMLDCIILDAENDLPKQYDMVSASLKSGHLVRPQGKEPMQ